MFGSRMLRRPAVEVVSRWINICVVMIITVSQSIRCRVEDLFPRKLSNSEVDFGFSGSTNYNPLMIYFNRRCLSILGPFAKPDSPGYFFCIRFRKWEHKCHIYPLNLSPFTSCVISFHVRIRSDGIGSALNCRHTQVVECWWCCVALFVSPRRNTRRAVNNWDTNLIKCSTFVFAV